MKFTFSFPEFLASFSRPHPARDWFIVLCLLVLLFIGMAGYAGYLFLGIRSGTIIGTPDESRTPLPTLTRNEITTVLESYRVRVVNFEARNFPIGNVTDPAR